ncbi:hypothetical protein DK254_06225 [Pseudomonas sp. RW407]|nr:hypothetical protein DK254_06225 [Pseudomonas sp. RW407]
MPTRAATGGRLQAAGQKQEARHSAGLLVLGAAGGRQELGGMRALRFSLQPMACRLQPQRQLAYK